MRVGVVGSGGREHAMAWKVSQCIPESDVFVLPGNGGTSNNVPVDVRDFDAVERACQDRKIDLLLVGPETPLADGIVDHFAGTGIRVFGPGRKAAQLESSKIWAKQFMRRHGAATADFEVFDNPQKAEGLIHQLDGNLVVKYDGLAGGKGVFVCHHVEEANRALRTLQNEYGPSVRFLIERRLTGSELSILGLTDGRSIKLLLPSQDHKPLHDGDRGPNTGGMGAFCPVPGCNQDTLDEIEERVIEPTMKGLQDEGIGYCGFIYFGLMMTTDGPKLLEYNVRLGDPEAEVILPALKTGLIRLVGSCFDGTLQNEAVAFHPGYYVDVVMASGGYPGEYATGHEIVGLDHASGDAWVFHAGTHRDGDRVLTAGGRVLNIVAWGEDLSSAIAATYELCDRVHFQNATYRKDIGARPWHL